MNTSEEKENSPGLKSEKWSTWKVVITVLWFTGLFILFHGIGYSRDKDSLDFKGGYFVIGILIVAPIYLYIRSIIDNEKGFPLENFNRDIVVQDIKRYKIFEDIDLTDAMIEDYVFGMGKDQNEYVNIFYNKSDIEFVKTRITIKYYNKSLPILTAFTNIDKATLNEIFQKKASTKVYHDKYISTNYYLDLEFLNNSDIKSKNRN